MIIDLDKDWFLDCDERNVTLTERRVIQAKEDGAKGIAPKPENIGKTREVQHGFYGNIFQACQGYLNKNVASMEGMLTATQIVAAWTDMTARIEAACKTIPKRGVAPPLTLADASDEMEAARVVPKTSGVEKTPVTSPAAPAFSLPTA